jgi:hypothetical protein
VEVAESVQHRIGSNALGLRRLSGFFEVVGWLELAAGIGLGIAIAVDNGSGDAFGESANGNVATGIAVGIGLGISALFLVAIARAMGLFAEYVAARLGTDLDELSARDEGGRLASTGVWPPDPTGRHELRHWDGARWTKWVADGGSRSEDDPPGLADLPAPNSESVEA